MCGIFGFVAKEGADFSKQDADKMLRELFILSETRGKESSGIAIRDFGNDRIDVFKEDKPATELIKTNYFRKFFDDGVGKSFANGSPTKPISVFAHSRLVTNGSQAINESWCFSDHDFSEFSCRVDHEKAYS